MTEETDFVELFTYLLECAEKYVAVEPDAAVDHRGTREENLSKMCEVVSHLSAMDLQMMMVKLLVNRAELIAATPFKPVSPSTFPGPLDNEILHHLMRHAPST